MAAVTSIMRVQQILLGRIETVLKPFGISFARFEMLRLLRFAQNGRMAMSRARNLLQVHPASVTNIVDRLEADGFVRRVAHPDDGRAVLVEITDQGSALVAEATDALNTHIFENTGFADTELATLTRLLADFRRRSGDFGPAQEPPDPL
ncbi:MarR family transcriptional regulator [Natronoglycomyces albus]|uniref:MarR family transcriptional regulator n=2 Tax=Natronoglycomyces albus TaxID=2811108 RepID=A0A895XUA0_9ACTN|nr:MarR family transcriptional regulator [Natronoglycomyces albus]